MVLTCLSNGQWSGTKGLDCTGNTITLLTFRYCIHVFIMQIASFAVWPAFQTLMKKAGFNCQLTCTFAFKTTTVIDTRAGRIQFTN